MTEEHIWENEGGALSPEPDEDLGMDKVPGWVHLYGGFKDGHLSLNVEEPTVHEPDIRNQISHQTLSPFQEEESPMDKPEYKFQADGSIPMPDSRELGQVTFTNNVPGQTAYYYSGFATPHLAEGMVEPELTDNSPVQEEGSGIVLAEFQEEAGKPWPPVDRVKLSKEYKMEFDLGHVNPDAMRIFSGRGENWYAHRDLIVEAIARGLFVAWDQEGDRLRYVKLDSKRDLWPQLNFAYYHGWPVLIPPKNLFNHVGTKDSLLIDNHNLLQEDAPKFSGRSEHDRVTAFLRGKYTNGDGVPDTAKIHGIWAARDFKDIGRYYATTDSVFHLVQQAANWRSHMEKRNLSVNPSLTDKEPKVLGLSSLRKSLLTELNEGQEALLEELKALRLRVGRLEQSESEEFDNESEILHRLAVAHSPQYLAHLDMLRTYAVRRQIMAMQPDSVLHTAETVVNNGIVNALELLIMLLDRIAPAGIGEITSTSEESND